ncbi:hypothetical protein [Streptomyces scabiei]|uniref:hypothetical protein n=1 Tax=Streptomyces scabiei TaxID=1930 RepID=UPI002FF38F1F
MPARPVGERLAPARGQPHEERGERERALHGKTAGHRRQRADVLADHRTQAAGQRVGRRATVGERGALVGDQFDPGQSSHGHPCRHDADDRRRGDERGPRLDAAHGEQDKSEQGVGGQDVAVEQQHRVQAAEHEESAEPTEEPCGEVRAGPARGGHLQGEAVSEQEREQQVELHLEQQPDPELGDVVQPRVMGWIGDEVERVAGGEEGEVHDEDPEQREPAQRVDIQ